MGKFNDVMDTFGDAADGAYSLPESIVGDLMGAYDEDMLVPAGEIEALTAANADLNTQIAALKAKNAELLLSLPGENGSGDSDPDPDAENEDISIDDLFNKDGE